jgi:hypothetical protein
MTTEIDGIQTNYRCLTLLSKSSKEKTNESQNPRAAAGFTAYDLSRLCSAPFSHSDRGLVDGLPCIRFLNKIAEPAVRAHRICPPHGTTNGNLVTAWEVYFMREGDPSQSAEAEAEAAFASAFPCHGGGR